MADLFPSYDETTASRIVRYHPSKPYAEVAIWDPPAAFTGTRPCYVFKSGGARQAKRDFRIGSSETSPGVHTVAGMMTEELGAYVCVYATPPGGIDFEAAEEPGQEYAPECRISDALAGAFLRGNYDNPDVFGSTRTASPHRRQWCGGGTSAGVFDNLGAQLIPAGDLWDLIDRDAARGGGRFRYGADHTFGFFNGAIGQNRISTFGEYVTSDVGVSSYVAAGTNNAGASVLGVSGDSITFRRHNRIWVTTTTSYVTSGAVNTGAINFPVSGDTPPIPAGVFVQVTASDASEHEFIVGTDYAGGAGTIDAREWSPGGTIAITPGAALSIRYEYAVRTDYAGGAGSVAVYPTLQFPVAAGSVVELIHPNQEGYGEHSWAVGYCGTASLGRVWRSDAASGRGVPLQEKRDGDLDRMARADNPRAFELNLMISGAEGESLNRVDILTGERSFWERRGAAVGAPAIVLPEHHNLHDTADMAFLMHQLYVLRLAAGINTTGLGAYLGGRSSNPLGTDAAVPWLLGRNAAFDAQVLKAWLTDNARFGGSFD